MAACDSEPSAKELEESNKYFVPIYEKADQLRTSNPDSTILMCNKLLGMRVGSKISDSLDTEVIILKAVTIFAKGDQEKAFEILKQGLKEKKDPYAQIRFYCQYANFLNDETRLEEAAYFVNKAIEAVPEGKYELDLASCYNLQGQIYTLQGKYKEAEASLNKALELFEKLKKLRFYAAVLQNIGNLYGELNDSITARTYYIRCAKIHESLNYKPGLSSIYNNIGIMYRHTHPDSALYYYNKIPAPNVDMENVKNYIIGLYNKANIYYDRNQFDTATHYYDQVLNLCKENNILQGYPMVLSSYGDIAAKKRNYKEAINYIDQAIAWCDSIGFISFKQQFLEHKVEFLKQDKQFEQALLVQELADHIQDSIKTNEIKASLKKVEEGNRARIDLLQKLEQEKQNAKNETIRMWIAIVFGSLIILTAIIILFQQNKKGKTRV